MGRTHAGSRALFTSFQIWELSERASWSSDILQAVRLNRSWKFSSKSVSPEPSPVLDESWKLLTPQTTKQRVNVRLSTPQRQLWQFELLAISEYDCKPSIKCYDLPPQQSVSSLQVKNPLVFRPIVLACLVCPPIFGYCPSKARYTSTICAGTTEKFGSNS